MVGAQIKLEGNVINPKGCGREGEGAICFCKAAGVGGQSSRSRRRTSEGRR